MHRYLDDTETPQDEIYQKMEEQLDGFIKHLPSEEDKQVLTRMVSECCHKHHEAIKSMEDDDPSLMTPLIMALILDQNLMIDQLQKSEG